MPVERSAGAVIFREAKKRRMYLLLQHEDRVSARAGKPVAGHWDFPKGHVEKRETTEETARREVREETGLDAIELVYGFKETVRYFVKIGEERRLKFVALFLARARRGKVIISEEHQRYAWLAYGQAYGRLTYAVAKNVLKKAEQFLSQRAADS